MWSGIETKSTEEKLREQVAKLEAENKILSARNDKLAENVKILEDKNDKLTESIQTLKSESKKLKDEKDTLETLRECSNRIIRLLTEGNNNKELKLEDFLDRQRRIFQNKVNHEFNVTNIYQEARYILEEVAELMRAIEKNDRENMLEELADIIIFTYGCAEVARLGDLDTKVFEKMAINEKREYKKTEEGDFVKTGGHLNE